MVEDVAEIRSYFVTDQTWVQADQLIEDVLQWRDRQAQGDQFLLQVVEAADRFTLEGLLEDFLFQFLQFFTELAHDREEIVDDEVEHGI